MLGAFSNRPAVAVAVVAFFGSSAAVAHAEGPPQPSDSAVAQYVEAIPTASGGQSGPGSSGGTASLSKRASAALQHSGPAAERLRAIATSPAYGAPSTGALQRSASARRLTRPVLGGTSPTRTLRTRVPAVGASISAIGTSAATLAGVAGLLAAVTAVLVFLAVSRRQRPGRDAPAG